MAGTSTDAEREFRGRIGPAVRRARWLGQAFRSGTAAALGGILLLAALFLWFLASAAGPEIRRAGLGFLVGSTWDPTTGVFGAGPAIVGTLLTSALALAFAVPVGLGVALLSAEIAPRRLRGVLAYFVELGAVIPSVVYGFWALIVLVPFLRLVVEPFAVRLFGPRLGFSGFPLGLDVLAAGAILGVMIVPTIGALGREALLAVPRERREAAYALGATRWEAARLAVLGPARPGIVGAIVLGLGRALGEAIAVVVVIGNSYSYPDSFLAPGTTVSSWLVNEFPDALTAERSALFELGLVLFAITLAVNVGARLVLRTPRDDQDERVRSPRRWVPFRRHLPSRVAGSTGTPAWWPRVLAARAGRIRRRRVVHVVAIALTLVALGAALYPLASLLHLAVENGGDVILRPSFYTEALPVPCYHNCSLGGVAPAIEGTLLLVGFASIVAVPVGLLGGIFLSEYARGRWRTGASLVVDALVGVPSILVGLFIFGLFFELRPGLAESAISGSLALSVLMLPIVVRTTETALRTVPRSIRESALALGFPRHRTVTRVVFGSCRGALVTGCLLAVARAGGETAALLFTVGWSQYGFAGWNQPVSALAPFIFQAFDNVGAPNWVRDAWGAALLLLLFMLGIGVATRLSLRTAQTEVTE